MKNIFLNTRVKLIFDLLIDRAVIKRKNKEMIIITRIYLIDRFTVL